MSHSDKTLIVIAGPTAVGKTALSIELALKLKAEIISGDSRQFYKETELGTAKPDQEELTSVKHHFINTLSIHDHYTVADFEKDFLKKSQELFQKMDVLLLVGGSGLFIKAACEGLDDLPDIDDEIRKSIQLDIEQNGLEQAVEKLKALDPEYCKNADLKNPRRVSRALEVITQTGKTFSSFRTSEKKQRPFNIIKIALEDDRDKLYKRIDERMDLMIEAGLFEEAETLHPYKELNALQTVGYSEIFGYLDGHYDKKEAVRLLKRNSRRYAKRQFTWFKKDTAFNWFTQPTIQQLLEFIEQKKEA